eukprot:scaffold3.g6571.t1
MPTMRELLSGPAAARPVAYLESLLRAALAAAPPSVAALSIALGACEAALTVKDEARQVFPEGLEATVARMEAAWDTWVGAVHEQLAAAGGAGGAGAGAGGGALDARAKVKRIADAHLFNFTSLLLPPAPGVKAGRRQLDCAGVVTTVYAACASLAARHGHADLAGVRMQVSEDHCWLQLAAATVDSEEWRRGSVEVTTVVPGKKGRDSELLQAVQWRLLSLLAEEAPGALYPAALCALADLLEVEKQDALDEALGSGSGAELGRLLARAPGDSQDLFELAIRMAAGEAAIADEAAADGAVATTPGEAAEEGPPAAAANGSAAVPAGVLPPGAVATEPSCSAGAAASFPAAGWQFYPYSYLSGYQHRRAEFMAKATAALPPAAAAYAAGADAALRAGLAAAAAGAEVLGRYRFVPATDDQLFKASAALTASDVEGVLEYCCDGLKALQQYRPLTQQQQLEQQDGAGRGGAGTGGKAGGGAAAAPPLADPSLLLPLLRLWDGACCLFAGRPKPSGWVALVLKTAKLFTPEARAEAATALAPTSAPVQAAARLWEALKPAALRPLFETADVGGGACSVDEPAAVGGAGGRAAKRQRA